MNDRDAVLEPVNRYAEALDAKDWALLDQVFTPEVVGEFGGGPLVGREAVREMVQRALGGCGPTEHELANHRVEIDGDTARCVCDVRAIHAGVGAAAEQRYELFGEYRDELVRTEQGWRIARREMIVHREIGSRDVLRGRAPHA